MYDARLTLQIERRDLPSTCFPLADS
jgi:hypothetical protein